MHAYLLSAAKKDGPTVISNGNFKPMFNTRFNYYLKCFAEWMVPDLFFRMRATSLFSPETYLNSPEIRLRVNYYCRLPWGCALGKNLRSLEQEHLSRRKTVYYFDSHEISRYFPKRFCWETKFGDNRKIFETPTVLKSRMIPKGTCSFDVLLKLNKVRHFLFVDDSLAFNEKKDMLVFRGLASQKNRQDFLEKYFGHPRCDVGSAHRSGGRKGKMYPFAVPALSIDEQLRYKFILCLEGNDVASNLKWAMSSNSLVVMPKPTCETWFMEGQLLAGRHYAEIKSDYSNLDEVMDYYLAHPEQAQAIIENANNYVKQFQNEEQERLIGYLVLKKYFCATEQLEVSPKEYELFFGNS